MNDRDAILKGFQLGVETATELFKVSSLVVTKHDLQEAVRKIMSAISEFADKVDAFTTETGASVDALVVSVSSLTDDVANLKKQIADLQNSTGGVTPEDQARIDKIQASSEALAVKTKAVADALAALDAQTENPPKV